jgi:hypothetical protein
VSDVVLTLTDWLARLSQAALAGLLARRSDTVTPPPRHLGELANRLQEPESVAHALHQLPMPALEVIEVLQLLGPDGGRPTTLLDWLGCQPTPEGDPPPQLETILGLLSDWGLVWPDGERLRMVKPLYRMFQHPLGLGEPAAVLLNRHPYQRLREIARTLGVPAHGRKTQLVTAISTAVTDPARVRQLVAGAEPAIRHRLLELALQGPEAGKPWHGYQPPEPALLWAAERGLGMTDRYGTSQLAREVALALRGSDWSAPFHPDPPHLAVTDVSTAAVAREAAAAGSAAVAELSGLLDAIGNQPCGVLKSGGIGVREMRRLARQIGTGVERVRFWLALAYQAKLLGLDRDTTGPPQLLPTAAYDEWAGQEPADQLGALLPHWLTLPAAPLLSDDGRSTALRDDPLGGPAMALRPHLLDFLASLPPDRAVVDPDTLVDTLGWHRPLLTAQLSQPEQLMTALWQEAELLGVVALGTLTPLGIALQEQTDPTTAARCLLPPAVPEAVFQADLTAVVPGTPVRALAELLDAAADRESAGGAVCWRFSPQSVRRALDAGHTPEELRLRLQERAVGRTLPQPLDYLITDVARRHGHLRVQAVACVLRSEDPALIAELVAARALRHLELSVLAPTVLGSAAPAAETLAALRAAGYAPVQESADGIPVLEPLPRRRARLPRPRRPEPAPTPTPAIDLSELATRLLAAEIPVAAVDLVPAPSRLETAPGPSSEAPTPLARLTAQLDPDEQRLLWHAIEHGTPVTISYVDSEGAPTTRVIEDLELDGHRLVAWCRLRQDERVFALRRIVEVAPVDES